MRIFSGMKTAVGKAPQFIVNEKGKQIGVLLDMKTYQRLIEAEEELVDQIVYDHAKAAARDDLKNGRTISIQDYIASRKNK